MIDQQSVERAAERFHVREGAFERLEFRRDRKQRNRRIRAGVLGIAIAVAVGWLGVNAIRSTAPVPGDDRSQELGIFAPVAGRVVYGNRLGIWGVDPAAPADPATTVQLTTQAGAPLGWSSDGTRLLIMRRHLFVLHADGTETQVTTDAMHIEGDIEGATISPDGSRVVFAAQTGTPDGARYALFAVEADGGPSELLVESQIGIVRAPTFSPDGTRIAYVDDNSDINHSVWLVDADGSDPHQIVSNETIPGPAGHVYGLAWSPAGDRIALGIDTSSDTSGTYTFAPDGSGFARVTETGVHPYWSPDGSQIAFSLVWPYTDRAGFGPLAIADADGSNVREFGFAASGPWHPGTPVEEPAPTPTPAAAASGSLAYVFDGDIYVADPDGSNAIKIADGRSAEDCYGWGGEYWAEGSMWSPDGRYLAYRRYTDCSSSDDQLPRDVVISDAEGSVVATFPAQGWKIAWSPDSTRVAVWDRLFETIGVYGLDGAQQTQLAMPSGWNPSGDNDPVWMPDGASLTVDEVELPLDGSTPRQLPWGAEAYSPDASLVAYVDHRSLTVARSDGSEPREVFGNWVWNPTWSPTGDRIAFVTHDGTQDFAELHVLDVATGSVTLLTEAERGSWLGVTVMGFSPQGDRILFSRTEDRGEGEASLWSIGVDGSDARLVVAGTTWGWWLSR